MSRKSTIISLVICLSLILILVVFLVFRIIDKTFKIPDFQVEVSGTIVDNDYNNYISGGDLVRIDDKLYFNYLKSGLKYGLFEIDENGSNRVYWHDYVWPEWDRFYLLSAIRNVDGEILVYQDNLNNFENFMSYSYKTQTSKNYDLAESVPNLSLAFQKYGDKIYYKAYYVGEFGKSTEGAIWVYDGKESKELIGGHIVSFYVKDDKIFYFETTSENSKFITLLKKYDIATGSNEIIYKFDDISMIKFIVENNYVVFGDYHYGDNGEYGVCKINLSDEQPSVELISLFDDVSSINAYNNNVYVASNSGVKRYNLDTNEEFTLYDKSADASYIVDDKWIYIVDESFALYRITQNGENLEKVFG